MSDCITTISLWEQCAEELARDIPNDQFNTWIRPLQAQEEGSQITLYAPNQFVIQWVKDKYLNKIETILSHLTQEPLSVRLGVGSIAAKPAAQASNAANAPPSAAATSAVARPPSTPRTYSHTNNHSQKNNQISFLYSKVSMSSCSYAKRTNI